MKDTTGNFTSTLLAGPLGFLLVQSGIHQGAHLPIHAHRLGQSLFGRHRPVNGGLSGFGVGNIGTHFSADETVGPDNGNPARTPPLSHSVRPPRAPRLTKDKD
jgi:hypothetical protein